MGEVQFKDGQLVQVAQVVEDIDKAMKHYWEDFGIGPWEIYEYGPDTVQDSYYRGKPNTQRYALAVTWVGPIQYELMQPLDGYSIYNEFIDKHGYGLQHVKFYYKDCQKAIKEYEAKGYAVIQSGRIGEDEFYYLESEDKVGTILELGNAGEIPPPLRVYPAV